MDPYDFLLARRSVSSKNLEAPGPTAEERERLFALAVAVPDHGRLEPFRFVTIEGAAKDALAEDIGKISRERDGNVEKDRKRFSYAPLVVAVVARLVPGHKVPEQEQLLTAGCAAMNLLYGAHALGYAAQWLTGWLAYDAAVAARLGLGTNEKIVGFVHIGTAGDHKKDHDRPNWKKLVTALDR